MFEPTKLLFEPCHVCFEQFKFAASGGKTCYRVRWINLGSFRWSGHQQSKMAQIQDDLKRSKEDPELSRRRSKVELKKIQK